MEREGLVYKVKGRGAFVTGRKFESTFVQHAAGFHASMTGRRHAVASEVLLQEVAPASAHVARMLGLDVGSPVLALDRVRSVDGVPIQVVRAWMPHGLCRGLEAVDLRDASVYAVLAGRHGLTPHHGRQTIEAVAMPADEARLLGVPPGSPGLLVESVTSTVDDLAFEGGSAWLFGCVLDRFFARYVSINSFVQTVLRTSARGEILRETPRCGTRPIF